MHVRPNVLVGALGLWLAIAGCSASSDSDGGATVGSDGAVEDVVGAAGDSDASDATDGQTGTDGTEGADGATGNDAVDGADSTDGTEPWEPPPVAPDAEAVPVVFESVMVAPRPSTSDPLGALLDTWSVELPESGLVYDMYWGAKPVDEEGAFEIPSTAQVWYAAFEVELESDVRASVLLDRVSAIWVNGVRQPGDPYGSGSHRVPAKLRAGKNLIFAVGSNRGQKPKIRLWAHEHEVAFVPTDRTWPHLDLSWAHGHYLGLPVLNLTDEPLLDVRCQVVASEYMEATERVWSVWPSFASVQLGFELKPVGELPEEVPVTLRVAAPGLEYSYEWEVTVARANPEPGSTVRRTFLSEIDGSVQYFAVRGPTEDTAAPDSLVLTLHGASVQAQGQANAYSAKPDVWHVAPTNRRPFGFDWEAFGRLDGLEVLELASEWLPVDRERVYLTGHSMGGHGSWQFGVLYPGRFAVVGPSAGWSSFDEYGGGPFPSGVMGYASLSSQTKRYVDNLAQRGVYIIHGTADDNVPVSHARSMRELVEPVAAAFGYHEQEGAGHWWNVDPEPGADCVDWKPLFEMMGERTLDPEELEFFFISPSPGVSPTHSYLTLRAKADESVPCSATSTLEGDAIVLSTENVVALSVDGDMLAANGVVEVTALGETRAVEAGTMSFGPETVKRPDAYGPFSQAFHQPFCFVWDDAGPVRYQHIAASLLSSWNIIGNGTGCALPLSKFSDALAEEFQPIYLGVMPENIPDFPESLNITWDEVAITVDGAAFGPGALMMVFPHRGRLAAVMATTRTHEYLLDGMSPFSSRFWFPDFVVYGFEGLSAAGFFDENWAFDPSASVSASQ